MRIKNQLPKSLSPAEWNGRRAAGFTLVELLVVIAIIGMITAIAVPTVFSAVRTARNAAVKSELELLHVALMNYKNEYGTFPPANMQGLWSGGAVNVRSISTSCGYSLVSRKPRPTPPRPNRPIKTSPR